MEEIVGGQEEFIVSHVKRKKAEESKIETQITGSISGPKLKISKKEIDIFEINDLPTGELYERSYMHKDIIHKSNLYFISRITLYIYIYIFIYIYI